MMSMEIVEKFDGIFLLDRKLATINLIPGRKVYGEDLFRFGKKEYRLWDVYRSKPAAALKRGIKSMPISKGSSVLYLGAASGTTVSHFSDIVGKSGIIYAVDIAERVLRELIAHAEARGNIVPMLADARMPEKYSNMVLGKVDVLYEDVASKDQIEIFIRNAETFLKKGGYAMIAIKSQSIDVTKPPRSIYKQCLEKLSEHFKVLDKVELDPYEKMHLFVVLKYEK